MSEWCKNRFEITGKSVCLDVLTQWIEGRETRATVMPYSRVYSCFWPVVQGW